MNILLERDFCSFLSFFFFFFFIVEYVLLQYKRVRQRSVQTGSVLGGGKERRSSVLPGSRGGSGAVRRDAVTPDLYSITLCCCGWHKRKTQSDLIGCDWSCSASFKALWSPDICRQGEAGNTGKREGETISWAGNGGNITRLPTNGVDIYVAGVYYFPVSERVLIFCPAFSVGPSSPLPSIRHMCRRDKGRPFVIKTPD